MTVQVVFLAEGHLNWDDGDTPSPNIILAECKEAILEAAGSDPMGQVVGGRLTLFCHIRPVHNRTTIRAPGWWVAITSERFDDGYNENDKRSTLGFWFCVLAYREPWFQLERTKRQFRDAPMWVNGYITGLILEIVQEEPRLYRRVGMFSHGWGRGTADDSKETFPEFVDVEDPKSLPREEITII